MTTQHYNLTTQNVFANDDIFSEDQDSRQPLLSPMTPPSNFLHDTLLEDDSRMRHYLRRGTISPRQGPTSSGATTSGTLRRRHCDVSLLSSPSGAEHDAPQNAMMHTSYDSRTNPPDVINTSPSTVAPIYTPSTYIPVRVPIQIGRWSPARSWRSVINYHIPQLFRSHALSDEYFYIRPQYGHHWFSETALNGMDWVARKEWAELYGIEAYPNGEPDPTSLLVCSGEDMEFEVRVYEVEHTL